MKAKTALVTGITGQDGSYLAELLVGKGYRVAGLVRPERKDRAPRLDPVRDQVELIPVDLLDQAALLELLRRLHLDEVYNLAATTFVPACWDQPAQAIEFSTLSVTRLLDAIRQGCPSARFFQAGSSEMFGNTAESPQRETTPFHPRSPYGATKASAHYITTAYREAYGLFACSGILFNHESPRRGLEFVTRKITHAVARIKLGLAKELRLGNLQAKRDWGYAGDYVRAMWLMLQQETAEDYVIGTGETHSVEEFVRIAFDHVGLDWHDHVVVDPQFYRPAEVFQLVADPAKARQRLGWRPEVSFRDLVESMVEADLAALSRQKRTEAQVACFQK
ncbi:MAG TPA: GDP-mannose 4,6-dehydratase [Gemmataceae bacterium]|nr:GDP-mannose 4,6-dehydratase [Gemmataceae bacterium]